MSIRNCALESKAFTALKEVWDHRDAEAAKWRAQEKKVVGKLGFDVPDELLIAADMLPVQIYADPDRSLEETNKYLEYAFEPVVRAQFEKLIDGTYGEQLDALAISNSTDVVIRIFLYLRELHRVEPEKNLPPFAFIDWLFTRHQMHQKRNEFVIDLFRKQVEEPDMRSRMKRSVKPERSVTKTVRHCARWQPSAMAMRYILPEAKRW